MFGCRCFDRNPIPSLSFPEPHPFTLPAPIPEWPQGQGFATGIINLGEIEVFRSTRYELIWCSSSAQDKQKGVTFYKPIKIPDGFHCLGHYCLPNDQRMRSFLLVAREASSDVLAATHFGDTVKVPPLREPLDYILICSFEDGNDGKNSYWCYIWLPQPPKGYKPMGYLVTNKPEKPELSEIRCVRADLTDRCETHCLIHNLNSKVPTFLVRFWNTRPYHRGMMGKGVPVGTFYCGSYQNTQEDLPIACLKNLNPNLPAMPNLKQIHALINHYGPTVFFHPEEVYLPSSVSWFFKNGALLYRKGALVGEAIEVDGSNLPRGETNDGKYWIDLLSDDRNYSIKCGDLESAKLYVHVKPALGGIFSDFAMWVFCPFNGPVTIKVGIKNIALSRIGRHVGDWEHFTLRVCNFTGELWSIYFSQHSGGVWVDAYDLEYIAGNKAIVYSSKSGHASYPHPGTYIQGSAKLGIGIRNDCALSEYKLDSSVHYEIVAAEYLGVGVVDEPGWLQFMRLWGPTIKYGSRMELDKIINRLPASLRYSVESIFSKLPVELYGEEGPTGPKEKNNWYGDERG